MDAAYDDFLSEIIEMKGRESVEAVTAVQNAIPIASVSAILPVWNGCQTIGRAIDSVACQTLMPLELIIIDDGSDDGTSELVRGRMKEYSDGWIKLITLSENKGVASARNAGWNVARGDYLAFLDADDTWHPKKIEHQLGYMRIHPSISLCGHGFTFENEPLDFILGSYLPEAIRGWQLLISNSFVTPSIMIKRDLPFRFMEDRRYMEDHLLWMQIALHGYPIIRLPDKLVTVYKALYGESGLSSALWEMEKDELQNYWLLNQEGFIGKIILCCLIIFSLSKYLRRLVKLYVRKMTTKRKLTST